MLLIAFVKKIEFHIIKLKDLNTFLFLTFVVQVGCRKYSYTHYGIKEMYAISFKPPDVYSLGNNAKVHIPCG